MSLHNFKKQLLGLTIGSTLTLSAGAAIAPIMTYRGHWSNTVPYAAGSLVIYNNSAYLNLVRSIGKRPDENANIWQLVAGTGLQGPTGATGPMGLPGLLELKVVRAFREFKVSKA